MRDFRELYQQRAQKAKLRLQNLDGSPASSACSSRSRTPVVDEEELREKNLCEEREAYNALVTDGGRPSHPISLGSDVLNNPGKYKDIIWFWQFFIYGFEFEQDFQKQLALWKDFREFQDRARRFYLLRKRFHEYEAAVRESWEDAQLPWDIKIHEDRHKQNRLENWNEFRSFYYRKLKAQRKRMPLVEKKFFESWQKLEDIEPGLGGDPPKLDDDFMTRVMDGERREEDARARIK